MKALRYENESLAVSDVAKPEVNGEAVADLTYDGIGPQGGVGLFVGGDLNEVVLEWLRIEIS